MCGVGLKGLGLRLVQNIRLESGELTDLFLFGNRIAKPSQAIPNSITIVIVFFISDSCLQIFCAIHNSYHLSIVQKCIVCNIC